MNADGQPNSDVKHLLACLTKAAVFNIYKEEMSGEKRPTLAKSTFICGKNISHRLWFLRLVHLGRAFLYSEKTCHSLVIITFTIPGVDKKSPGRLIASSANYECCYYCQFESAHPSGHHFFLVTTVESAHTLYIYKWNPWSPWNFWEEGKKFSYYSSGG